VQTASNDSATASKAETQEGEEEDGYELSQRDVGKTLKVDCGEDGMIPVVLLEHRRRQRFLVRFKSDNKQMEVDLRDIQWQFQSKVRVNSDEKEAANEESARPQRQCVFSVGESLLTRK
jgi:hypothetical protein